MFTLLPCVAHTEPCVRHLPPSPGSAFRASCQSVCCFSVCAQLRVCFGLTAVRAELDLPLLSRPGPS